MKYFLRPFFDICFNRCGIVLCFLFLCLVSGLSVAQGALLRDVAKPLSTNHKPLRQTQRSSCAYQTGSASSSRSKKTKHRTASVTKKVYDSQDFTYCNPVKTTKKHRSSKKVATAAATSHPALKDTDDDFSSNNGFSAVDEEDDDDDFSSNNSFNTADEEDDDDDFSSNNGFSAVDEEDDDDDFSSNNGFSAVDEEDDDDDFSSNNGFSVAKESSQLSPSRNNTNGYTSFDTTHSGISESHVIPPSTSVNVASGYTCDTSSKPSSSPLENEMLHDSANAASKVLANVRERQAPSSAHKISPEHIYGKGVGYKFSEQATVILPDGRRGVYNGDVPSNKIPVVVHSGRPDNGSEWGKHIEYRDAPPLHEQLSTTDKIELGMSAGGAAIGVGQIAGDYFKKAEESYQKGQYEDAALNAAGAAAAGAAAVGIIYATLKTLFPTDN